MPSRSLSLDGEWQLTGINPAGQPEINIKAEVPGHVHLDLLRSKHIRDPFWRDQADECQWVESWTWHYQTVFYLPADFNRSWNVLDFGGLDTYASITLNGTPLGARDNMFVPQRFEVGNLLRSGENRLEVRFTPYQQHIQGKSLDYPAAFDTHDRVHVRRMQCTFHWDWVNRFISAGIWRPVTLYSYDSARLSDLFVFTQAVDASSASLRLGVELERRTSEAFSARLVIEDPSGKKVWTDWAPVTSDRIDLKADLANAQVWFPHGYGEQPIYTCRALLCREDGAKLDERVVHFGIRTVRVEQLIDAPGSSEYTRTVELRRRFPNQENNGDEPGRSFTLIVNGMRIFCKGGNWVPCDPFPSRVTPEHYERLIHLAHAANINLLRAWGGGIYEPDAFWDACDRSGVMVSQDFAMACAQYPEDDPEFLIKIRAELPQAIRMLRNHPSLVWWCGDNENGMNHDADDLHYPGRLIAETISAPLLRELDPSRPFFPTSPYRGKPNTSISMGDAHFSSFPSSQAMLLGKLSDYQERIARTTARFMSESAVMGAPPMRSMLKFMTPKDIADPSGYMWHYHTKNNPYMDITLYENLEQTSQLLFGSFENIEQKVRAMGYLQYEWVRLAVASARRSKWYCSGLQFWMYNDCWPASGWSLVDYYGYPKAGYYAFRRAARPLAISFLPTDFAIQVWVCSDLPQPASGELTLRIQSWQGAPSWQRKVNFEIPANSSKAVHEIHRGELAGLLTIDSVLVGDLSSSGDDRGFYYLGMPNQMKLPPAHLQVRQEVTESSGILVISTDVYARVVTLDADLDFTDNYFDLLPGEERTIEFNDPRNSEIIPPIPVYCWNQALLT